MEVCTALVLISVPLAGDTVQLCVQEEKWSC